MQWPVVRELGERIARMLEGVAGQRAQRLDFAHRRQPAPHRRPRARRQSSTRTARCGVHSMKISAIRTKTLSRESRYSISRLSWPCAAKAALPSAASDSPQRGQQRRMERLALEPHQHLGEQPQLVRRLFHRRHHRPRSGADAVIETSR